MAAVGCMSCSLVDTWSTRDYLMHRRRHPHSGRPQRGAGEGAGGGARLVAGRQ